MTIVVYRDGIMAADSLVTSGGTRTDYVNKLATNKAGWVGGAAGDFMDCRAFSKWVKAGCKKEFKGAEVKDGLAALLLSPTGDVFYIDDTNRKTQINSATYHCVGSGRDIAMGALEMGATAEQAVAVAIKLNTSCGGIIHTLKRKA